MQTYTLEIAVTEAEFEIFEAHVPNGAAARTWAEKIIADFPDCAGATLFDVSGDAVVEWLGM